MQGEAVIHYADLWGSRLHKYNVLASSHVLNTEWSRIYPTSPFYIFAPFDYSYAIEHSQLPAINDVFPLGSNGIKTHRDHFSIAFTEGELTKRIYDLRDSSKIY